VFQRRIQNAMHERLKITILGADVSAANSSAVSCFKDLSHRGRHPLIIDLHCDKRSSSRQLFLVLAPCHLRQTKTTQKCCCIPLLDPRIRATGGVHKSTGSHEMASATNNRRADANTGGYREHRDFRASFSPSWKTAERAAKCARARAREKKSSHGVHGAIEGVLAGSPSAIRFGQKKVSAV
jgi:hypothetical protein